MSIKSRRELGDRRKFVFELGFGGEVLEFVDKVLESIVWSSVFILSRFLNEFGQVSSGLYFGVKGVKVLVVVFNKDFKGFVLGFERSIFQSVIPFLREGNAFPGSHLAQNEGEF